MATKVKLTRQEKYEVSGDYDYNMEYNSREDVKNGSWILVTRNIPVSTDCKPMVYGIYWGIPHEDSYGRQCCKIHTIEDVVLLNHEYTTLSEEKVNEYRENGWTLRENGAEAKKLNMEIIENGRALCEEEREVIWALQLDGLTEEQACEEYFLSKHTDYNNYTICYLPTQEIYNEIVSCFGTR